MPLILAFLVVVGIQAGLGPESPRVTAASPPAATPAAGVEKIRLVSSRPELNSAAFAHESTRHVLRDPAKGLAVTIPPQSALQLSFGIRSGKWKFDDVEFTVTFRSGDQSVVLLRQRVGEAQLDQWQEASIPLAALTGKQGTIELATTAVRGNLPPQDAILWALPIIEPLAQDDGPNVILLSIDTLRADHLGSYGNQHATSPNLDRLAREGVRFKQAISPSSWTLPSHASMLTGVFPSRHGAVRFDLTERISTAHPTLAEVLWDAGYNTVAFTEDVFVGPNLGFARGFDQYDAPTVAAEWFNGTAEPDVFARNLDQAKRWLERRGNRRFFMFLHTYTIHMPYVPPPPYDTMFDAAYQGPYAKAFTMLDYRPFSKTDALDARTVEHLRALYDGEIRYTDTVLGDFLTFLAAHEWAKRTCIIVTSDHGEEFKEHGNLFHRHAKLNEEVVRVPMIVWCPGRYAGGQVIEQPVSVVDVTPTVLDVIGVSMSTPLDGVSFEPTLRGQAQPPRTLVSEVDGSIAKRGGNLVALRTAQYKFLQASGGAAPVLYDLQNDPGETQDVSSKHPDVVAGFAKELQALALAPPKVEAAAPAASPAPKPTVDAGTLERMRNLGYTD